jgi:NAD(P)-dependent dehydrogenase (short-subunit alcohol dehydrogenase family)
MRIGGRAVLVTGGSRGLGAALGKALASRGARVVLLAREAEPVEAMAAAIRATGGEAHALSADLGDATATARVAGVAAALVGPLDLLVHNASALGPLPLRPLLDITAEDLQRVLAVNLLAPFRLSRALVGSMLVRGGGLVLHVSSDAATGAYPGWGAYGVSKAALDHLARIWAAELEGTGVRFLSVDPGEMDTRMHAQALPEADPATLRDPAQVAEAMVALIGEAETLPSGARVEAAAWLRPAAVSS